MKNLIIVESPTKARTLSRFLGKEYVPLATGGHIKDLPKSKLSIDVEKNFEPDYVVVPRQKDTIGKIIKEAEKASKIYLATDPDREGEAIAKHVEEILVSSKNKIPKSKLTRIVFHEITKSAIEKAIEHPKSVDEKLVDAQIARRVLDRLVGYKLSPLLWKKVRRGLSAGRVQSVAVRLIVEKEREIEAFKPVEYWEIGCKVRGTKDKVKPFIVNLVKIDDKKAEIGNTDEAKKVVTDLEGSDYKVSDVRKKEVRKSPYPPLTTSTMTQSAARLFSWSAKKTMSVAQKLYEEGLITYHRTDSVNVSKVALSAVRKYIKNEYGDKYIPEKPKYYKKASKLAQEAHEAIRPTDVKTKYEAQGTRFAKEGEMLYSLIWKRFVASQMTQSVFDRTTIEVLATPKHHTQVTIYYLLRVSGQIMKFNGWRKVIPLSKSEDPELPNVEKDEAIDLIKVMSEQKFTQPPARFNEASLIKKMESLGIGRPSTYAPTISTIQTRQYVEKKERRFYPTPVGTAVTDFLVKNFPGITDYSFTAGMEDELDNVARGEQKWQKMMKDFYGPFDKKLEKVEEKAKRVKIETEKLGRKCPTCKKEGRTGDKRGELVIRTGRFGKFISCSNFPDCKHTEKYVEKLKMKCPTCKKGDVIIKSTRRGKKFYGCSRYPDCDWASWRKPSSE
ncbi:type I DNA topoisomerase [Patescibacteria group bacterium]